MTEESTLKPGDKVVTLSGLARSVGIVSSVASAICYQVVYGVPDLLTILFLLVPAMIIGLILGWLVSMRFTTGGRDGTTVIVKHGRIGIPATLRTATGVGVLVSVVFVLIAKFLLGFDGSFIGLSTTIVLPAILVSAVWALLGSLA